MLDEGKLEFEAGNELLFFCNLVSGFFDEMLGAVEAPSGEQEDDECSLMSVSEQN